MYTWGNRSFWALLVLVFTSISGICAEYPKRINIVDGNRGIPIITGGKNQVVIVLPPNSCRVIKLAAGELQKFMEQALNNTVPIIAKPDESKTSIILGDNDYSRKAGIDVGKLPRDGFVIKAEGRNIFIAGKDDVRVNPEINIEEGGSAQLYERATLFGVYDFLERFLGVRFYFPGKIGTVVPEYKNLELKAMDIFDRPDYVLCRRFAWYRGQWYEGKDRNRYVDPRKNLNYYRLRMATKYIPNCHGLGRLGYLTRFGKSHPEYFALMSDGHRYNNPALPHSGQLCFSSRIREQIFKDARAFLTGKSAKEAGILTDRKKYYWDHSGFQPGYFNIMPQDSFYKCRCAKCQKYFSKGDQATSDFIWDFFREVAFKLKKEKVPGYLTTMAYSPYSVLPTKEIPDNILVMLAAFGPWENKPWRERNRKHIMKWVKKPDVRLGCGTIPISTASWR